MAKYFYDDTLKAAWMAKHFEMRIWGYPSDNLSTVDQDTILDAAWDKYYIHPESLHLLEPQDKDEGIDAANWQVIYFDNRWLKAGSGQEILPAKTPVKIDKRGGVAFMWPQEET